MSDEFETNDNQLQPESQIKQPRRIWLHLSWIVPIIILACIAVFWSLSDQPRPQQQQAKTTERIVEQTEKQPTQVLQGLTSKFFKNDPTAQSIATGQVIDYDIKTFGLTSGRSDRPASTNNFAYRVVSALRQLGYSEFNSVASDSNIASVRLKKFQRLNNLPITDVLSRETLLAIDKKLAESEALDTGLGKQFPVTNKFFAPPVNEPSAEHIGRILYLAFRALPENLVIWSENEFRNFFYYQMPGTLQFASMEGDYFAAPYTICPNFYYPEYDSSCKSPSTAVSTLFNKDDAYVVNTFLHEYAHYLDANLYYTLEGISRAKIDTKSFYDITYDTSKEKVADNGRKIYPLRRESSAVRDEFVSKYGSGNQFSGQPGYFTPYEDFAETFVMYVMSGKVFRSLSVNHPVLKQKYEWMNEHVFHGREYETGDMAALSWLKTHPNEPNGNIAANSSDFLSADENLVWNYTFKF